MSKLINIIRNGATKGVTKVVGGIFSTFRNLIVQLQYHGGRVTRNSRMVQWERSAKYAGWVNAKCYEDLTKTVFYLSAYNKSNENTLTLAVHQGKAVGCTPELHLYTKDKETGEINGSILPFGYDVKVLKDIFE